MIEIQYGLNYGRAFFSEMFHFMTNSPWKCSFYIADRIISQVCTGLIYNSVPYNRCLMVVPNTYGCPGLFHLSANYIKKTPFQSAASCRSTFLLSFSISIYSCCQPKKPRLGSNWYFFPLWKQRKTLGHYMVCKCSFETRVGRRGLLSATRDRNEPKKKAGWRGWVRNGVKRKKGWQEEIEQHRCIMCACWHTKDVVFTAGAAARHGNVPCSHCTHFSK